MKSLFSRPPEPEAAPAPPPPPVEITGLAALDPRLKWSLLAGFAVFGAWYVLAPGKPKATIAPVQEQHQAARIADAPPEPPPAVDPLTRISLGSNAGNTLETPTAAHRRRKVIGTEMSLYSAPVVVAPSAPSAARLGETAPGSASFGGEPGALPAPRREDALSAQLSGATALPTTHAIPIHNPDYLIRPGAKIPCLPIDAMDSSRTGFTSCRTVDWFPSSNLRR
ncbi:MAG: hypothetical protein ACRYGG_12500, partial [Janthinobacterium lividum]